MSDSIPEDVRRTAYELAFVWAMPDEAALTRCTDAIARAILAERERCARIADHFALHFDDPCDTAYDIARIIRKPDAA